VGLWGGGWPGGGLGGGGLVELTAMVGPDARYVQDPWSRSGRFYVIRWKFENTQPTIKKAPRV